MYFNIGNLFRETHRPREAIDAFKKVLEVDNSRGDTYANMAISYEDLGLLDEADECFRNGARLASDNNEAVGNLAYSLLRRGMYKEGWELYERRLIDVPHEALVPNFTPGQDISDKDVMVVTEQGYGDVIMYCGLLRQLKSDASSILLICDSALEPVLKRSLPGITVQSYFTRQDLEKYSTRIGLGSLGLLYRSVEMKQFASVTPYLLANEECKKESRLLLDGLGPGKKVGIAWKGGTGRFKKRRSLEIKELKKLIAVENTQWVSLQYNSTFEELNEFERLYQKPLNVLFDCTNDFEMMLGMITQLDHVITVQQTVVHIAGGVGAQCEVLIPKLPEWRYGTHGSKMPWWDSIRLHRQRHLGCWSEPLGQIVDVLKGT